MSYDPSYPNHKAIMAGPGGGEECCHCCYRCGAETNRTFDNCDTCPPFCCTCPPLCDLQLTLTSEECDELDGLIVTLTAAGDDFMSHYCCNTNPTSTNVANNPCYNTTPDNDECPGSGCQHKYEKWASAPAYYCTDGPAGDDPSCKGMGIIFSLCCCDYQNAALASSSFKGECKTCSYQFRTEFYTHPDNPRHIADNTQICSCLDDGGGGIFGEIEAIPPDQSAEAGNTHTEGYTIVWDHHSSSCGFPDNHEDPINPENWAMVYKLEDVYFNCDCCSVVDGTETPPAPLKTVNITAMVVPITPCPKGGP